MTIPSNKAITRRHLRTKKIDLKSRQIFSSIVPILTSSVTQPCIHRTTVPGRPNPGPAPHTCMQTLCQPTLHAPEPADPPVSQLHSRSGALIPCLCEVGCASSFPAPRGSQEKVDNLCQGHSPSLTWEAARTCPHVKRKFVAKVQTDIPSSHAMLSITVRPVAVHRQSLCRSLKSPPWCPSRSYSM